MLSQMGYDIDSSLPTILTIAISSITHETALKML